MVNTRPTSQAALTASGAAGHFADHGTLHATHNRTYDVVSYGGADNTGVSDATSAIQSCIDAAVAAGGGRVYFPAGVYTCSGSLNCDSTMGLELAGASGQRTIWNLTSTPAVRIRYTGTGARFIAARETGSFTLRNLAVFYTSGSFTGWLLDLGTFNTTGNPLTYFPVVADCRLSGIQSTAVGGSMIRLNKVVEASIDRCVLEYGATGIQGMDDSFAFCTAVRVQDTRFSNLSSRAIYRPGQQWRISGTVFEPSTAGNPSGVVSDMVPEAIAFINCGFWDATASGAWIDLPAVSGMTVLNCYFEQLSNSGTCIKVSGGPTTGVFLSGNVVKGSGTLTWVDPGGSTSINKADWQDFANTFGANAVKTYSHASIAFGELRSANFRSRVQSVSTDLTADGKDGVVLVSASAANRVYTLPSAATVGAGSRQVIKKTDATANTVTITRTGSDTIEGATTLVLANRWDFAELLSDGTSTWVVLAHKP